MEGVNASVTGGTLITVNVKFSGQSIPVTISLDSFVRDLKYRIHTLTNVLPRDQKLVSQGKLLVDDMTLRSSEMINGAKIMLIRPQGLRQGDRSTNKEVSASSNLRTVEYQKSENEIGFRKDFEHWKATGVIALSDCILEKIPDVVWGCQDFTRVLNISHNFLQEVPFTICCLGYLQELFLNGNGLEDDSISWEGLATLKLLTVLSLSHNHLTILPRVLGSLTSLKQLHIANNKLVRLPSEIGLLPQLEILMANNNRLSTVPRCMGSCISLVEVNLSSNLLTGLPETFSNLHNLKVLDLGKNSDLKYLPKTLFKMCKQLSDLDINGTEISVDLLLQFEGWDQFEQRFEREIQQQLYVSIVESAEFEEDTDPTKAK